MEYKYGDAWEHFPIEAGEVWGLPQLGSRVAVHNIFDPLPDFMSKADLLFIDPPWNLGNVNTFYTKAGRSDYLSSFEQFTNVLFQRIKEVRPKTIYIEIGKQNVDVFYKRLSALYPINQKWDVLYYRKHPTHIIRGSQSAIDYDFTGMDEAKCIEKIAMIEDYNVMGDLCMGRGLVGMAAFKAGKPFVGTELNKRRLACLLASLAKAGGEVKKYEEKYD